jgi:PKD repeat protein
MGGEGTEQLFALGSFTDADDLGPWTVDVNWGDGSGADSFQVDSLGDVQRLHVYADNGTYTVAVTVTDGSSESDSATFQVTVENVGPTLTAPDDQEADEGASTSFNLGSFSDPGVEDSPWTVTVDWGDGSASESFDVTEQGDVGRSHGYDDNGLYTVSISVTDKDGGSSTEETFSVSVANVAPSATFANDGPVAEGESFTLSLSGPSDPSPADTTAGFGFAFDCGDGVGYGPFGGVASAVCATSDDGARSVGGKIRDKDGDAREYTNTVMVENVAPTLTAAADQEADEGAGTSFELGSFSDPGAQDSPWTVAVDWGDGSGPEGFEVSAQGLIGGSHTYADNGVYTVSVTVTDKDDDASHAAVFNVTVHNVAPTITQFTGTDYLHGPLAFTGGASAYSVFTTMFDDPGTEDTHSADLEYQDGTPLTQTVSPFVSGQAVQHRFASAGCDKWAKVKVSDDDGDYDTAETTVDVGTGTFLPPMTNQPVTDRLKNGQVLPVKIRVGGCDGLGLTNLEPTIKLVAGDQTAVAEETTALIDPASVSAADTTGVMRHLGGGDYIYNMKVQLPLNTKYTVVIYPYGGTSGPRLAHLLEATK